MDFWRNARKQANLNALGWGEREYRTTPTHSRTLSPREAWWCASTSHARHASPKPSPKPSPEPRARASSGVTVENIESVVPDVEYSEMLTLKGAQSQ